MNSVTKKTRSNFQSTRTENNVFFLILPLGLPPAEVFSFAFHTALTEIAATASDSSGRKQVK